MADLDITAPELGEQYSAHLAGVGAAVRPEKVLRTDRNRSALQQRKDRPEYRIRRDDEEIDGTGNNGGIAQGQGADSIAPLERFRVTEIHLEADADGSRHAAH